MSEFFACTGYELIRVGFMMVEFFFFIMLFCYLCANPGSTMTSCTDMQVLIHPLCGRT